MKLHPPENENYAAVVVRVPHITHLSNCDNVVGVPVQGFQAITSKGIETGELQLLFTAETQLSEEYARVNNLHRHSDRNADESAKGYLEDNRRVKALKFRGHRSDALLMSVESVAYTGVDVRDLREGDVFDVLGDYDICKKYVVKRRQGTPKFQQPKEPRVDKKFLPEHFDTANYYRNSDVIAPNDTVVVTQKLHGTSIRVGHTVVSRKLKWYEKLAKKVGVSVQEFEYDYVYGSRKVIKDPNNPNQNHFYDTDLWTEEGSRLKGILPQGYLVYGELVGWVEGKTPIQKNYTYNIPEGTRKLFVYRVAHVNPQGVVVDLSWDQVKQFCFNLGLTTVPELWRGSHAALRSILETYFIDRQLHHKYHFTQAIPLSDPDSVDEGVCIRKDALIPVILKAKSPIFLEHETTMLDQEVEDIESVEVDG